MAGNANSGRRRTDPWERFRLFVQTNKTTGCWHWTGGKSQAFWDGDQRIQARTWAYAELRDAIPRGRRVKRTCRNKRCVSPYHAKVVGLTPPE